ncbi:helix-turn-helix DNA binding domain protein [Arthrobacter phage AbbyDaisy]|nr:helix-turn-helix DNA binding domain protein [Arthrobacter phage AbbyDaisy]
MSAPMALEDNTWAEDALATIIGLSLNQAEFTADDLRREMRPAPHQNAPGMAFAQARNLGYIESVSSATSRTRSRKNGALKTWRRKIEGVTS